MIESCPRAFSSWTLIDDAMAAAQTELAAGGGPVRRVTGTAGERTPALPKAAQPTKPTDGGRGGLRAQQATAAAQQATAAGAQRRQNTAERRERAANSLAARLLAGPDKLTIPELKTQLKARGLPTSVSKAEAWRGEAQRGPAKRGSARPGVGQLVLVLRLQGSRLERQQNIFS